MCSLFVFSWDITRILKFHKVYDSLSVKFSYKETLHATVAVTLNIFFFVYVHLCCIANNLKKISKMSTLPPLPGKISADAHPAQRLYAKHKKRTEDIKLKDNTDIQKAMAIHWREASDGQEHWLSTEGG